MTTAGYQFTHLPQKFTVRLPMDEVDESNARTKKMFCHFIGEIRAVPFENPLTREYQ